VHVLRQCLHWVVRQTQQCHKQARGGERQPASPPTCSYTMGGTSHSMPDDLRLLVRSWMKGTTPGGHSTAQHTTNMVSLEQHADVVKRHLSTLASLQHGTQKDARDPKGSTQHIARST
jgi:hypothetical protein